MRAAAKPRTIPASNCRPDLQVRREAEMKKPYRMARELTLLMVLALVVFSPGALLVLAQAPAP